MATDAIAGQAVVTGCNRFQNPQVGVLDGDEIGPRMLARIAKRTGLRPEDL